MKRNLLSMSLMLPVCLVPPSLAGAGAGPSPGDFRIDVHSRSGCADSRGRHLFRNNDLMGLLRAMVPPSQLQLLRQGYDEGARNRSAMRTVPSPKRPSPSSPRPMPSGA